MKQLFEKAFVWTDPSTLESEAFTQIKNISEMPFVFKHVAVMPDCHVGKGATVGTVIATTGAVIPAAVGVDIGCGMIAVKTNLKLGQLKDLKAIREGIERRIPMSAGRFNTKFTESAKRRIKELEDLAGEDMDEKFGTNNWRNQLGTLGGGNHFIEVCLDEENNVWATLHSGSRGIGNKIGNHYIKVAQELMDKMLIKLVDKDLSYLAEGTEEFNNYIKDLRWAQKFALLNREEMMDRMLTELKYSVYGDTQTEIEIERINCHHNFTQIENHFNQNVWVTRKGAIQARLGMKGMIPGSMGTRSYIVSGLQNDMAFHSAPHGAGRRFSRSKAKEKFTLEDMDKAMAGIEFRRDQAFIDEIPGAYKDIDEVMENAKELVKVEHVLKQIINCKGE
jgi:tRNA-splicing ligase RtcB (3'-phosphate/5'-hydroxy nucleic acid ligase)